MPIAPVAIAHDYLTRRGGSERVVGALARAFPNAPIHTSVYEPDGTFEDFERRTVITTGLQRIRPLRHDPRLALPVLASVVSRHRIEAEVTICSTSGWAHGFPTSGAKVLYVHNTARWLYEPDDYLAHLPRRSRAGLAPLARSLRGWDARAVATADVILTNSAVTAARIRQNWGRTDVEVLHPPLGIDAAGPRTPIEGLAPGFLLTVSRLLPSKRVDVVLEAVSSSSSGRPLVIVGDGPDAARLQRLAPPGTRFVPRVHDDELRWLYEHAAALVSAANDDFALTPLEAMGFGTPVVAVDEGDVGEFVVHGVTGLRCAAATPQLLAAAIDELDRLAWDTAALQARARSFSDEAFAHRLRQIVEDLRTSRTAVMATSP